MGFDFARSASSFGAVASSSAGGSNCGSVSNPAYVFRSRHQQLSAWCATKWQTCNGPTACDPGRGPCCSFREGEEARESLGSNVRRGRSSGGHTSSRVEESSQRRGSASIGRSDRTMQLFHHQVATAVGRVGEAACFRGRKFARSQGLVGKIAWRQNSFSCHLWKTATAPTHTDGTAEVQRLQQMELQSKLSQVGIQQELTRDNISVRDAEHGKKRFREDYVPLCSGCPIAKKTCRKQW